MVPDPVCEKPPGEAFKVHVPVGGRPDKLTDPVLEAQVGFCIVPTTGALGLMGALTKTLFDGAEVHADEIKVTVKVYEPIGRLGKTKLAPMPV